MIFVAHRAMNFLSFAREKDGLTRARSVVSRASWTAFSCELYRAIDGVDMESWWPKKKQKKMGKIKEWTLSILFLFLTRWNEEVCRSGHAD